MREVKKWMEKAEKDLLRAKLLFSSDDFEGCAFHAHQAAEKALKALYILKFKRLWKIHDLKELSLKLNAGDKVVEACKKLNPHYVETRYPTEMVYTKRIANDALKNASLVVEWARKKLRR